MPLIKSDSDEARSKNIAKEVASGKDPKQAAAIAYDVQREAKKKKDKDVGQGDGAEAIQPKGKRMDKDNGEDMRKQYPMPKSRYKK